MILPQVQTNFTATRNACKLCTPLGACFVFRGIEGCVPFLHGSQGCSTYIRRYMISHFKEPVDIASSNFSEHSAIFGGGENLRVGLANVIKSYQPQLVGLATTCLAETIGDDLKMHLHEFMRDNQGKAIPPIVHVSTASYRGTHMDGFHDAVKGVVMTLVGEEGSGQVAEWPSGRVKDTPSPQPPPRRVCDSPGGRGGGEGSGQAEGPGIPGIGLVKEEGSGQVAEWPSGQVKEENSGQVKGRTINVFPNMVSPSDLRHMREIVEAFGMSAIMLPDYSDTLDGPTWDDYHKLPPGGTPVADLRRMNESAATIEFGSTWDESKTAGAWLSENRKVNRHALPLPIGVRATDRLMETLSQVSGQPVPKRFTAERGRLLDSFVDAHKHCFDLKAVVYGEEDLVVGLASLLAEIGVVPVLCASGQKTGRFEAAIKQVTEHLDRPITALEGVDFLEIEAQISDIKPDLLIGHSKGQSMARKLDVPLVRVGFPIHDRVGGARLLHVGYEGSQRLFDTIINTVIQQKQEKNPWGYSYM